MHFEKGHKYVSTIEVDGFKFRKEVTRRDFNIRVAIKTLGNELIDYIDISDRDYVDQVDEILGQSIYNYIENNADDLDKIMARFMKGGGF
ncbi:MULTISPECIES: DUF1108 family protein [unclassified Staphylococcus]|uniref:DUF1108 family protein n=1 Tax=unclassified Staphylococcus TaxID=91994 RepID=UPI0021CF953B|nr:MULTISPECIES: DUF1108 family protein [unclassified Staphylococcus]UXR73324.1 DUF1108 family protein [Staphylococcus sp. IVB6238]UXR75631.1 DUF1108 family protein [Staphylococcus sp. IVB6233]